MNSKDKGAERANQASIDAPRNRQPGGSGGRLAGRRCEARGGHKGGQVAQGHVEVLGEVSIEQGVPGVEATRAALVELLAPVDVSGVWMTGLAVSGALDHSDRLDRSIAMADFVGRRPAGEFGSVLPGVVMTLHGTQAAPWAERGLEVAQTGRRYRLASAQNQQMIDARPVVRSATLAEFRRQPGFARE